MTKLKDFCRFHVKVKKFWLENIFDVLCVEIASQNIKARFLIKKRNRQHKSRIARRYENSLVMKTEKYVFFPAGGDRMDGWMDGDKSTLLKPELGGQERVPMPSRSSQVSEKTPGLTI